GYHVQVVQAQPVLLVVPGVKLEGHDLSVVLQFDAGGPTQLFQLADTDLGFQPAVQGEALRVVLAADGGFDCHGFAVFPLVLGKVVGGAADGVHRIVPDVSHPILIEVHRVGQVAAGYELGEAHRPGVGTGQAEGIDLLLAGQYQEGFELAAEEVGPGTRIEAQGGQGSYHPTTALGATIEGLHTKARQDNFRLDAIDFHGTGQRTGGLVPERHPPGDAAVGDEDLAGLVPGADPLGGPGYRLQDGVAALGLGPQLAPMLGIVAV